MRQTRGGEQRFQPVTKVAELTIVIFRLKTTSHRHRAGTAAHQGRACRVVMYGYIRSHHVTRFNEYNQLIIGNKHKTHP
jgi:hypothetical protein